MSDTESIQFDVASEVVSPRVLCEGKNTPRGGNWSPAVKDVKLPPLAAAFSLTSHKGLRRCSETSSLQFVVNDGDAAGEGDINTENTDTIQFQTEGASRSVSFREVSATSMAGNRRSVSGGKRRQWSSSGSADGSVVFVVEDTHSTGGKRASSNQEASHDGIISFVAVDSGDTEAGVRSDTQKSLSFTVMSAKESPGGASAAALEKDAKWGPASIKRKASPPIPSSGDAAAGKPGSKSKPRPVTEKVKEKRGTTRPTAQETGTQDSAVQQGDDKVGGEAFNVCGAGGEYVLGTPPNAAHIAEREKKPLRTLDVLEKLQQRDSGVGGVLIPNTSLMAAPPLPHPSQKKISLKAADIEEMVLQAKLYTEHWRMFNDIQREEVEQLSRRITRVHEGELEIVGEKNGTFEGNVCTKEKPLRFAEFLGMKSFLKESDLPWNRKKSNVGGNERPRELRYSSVRHKGLPGKLVSSTGYSNASKHHVSSCCKDGSLQQLRGENVTASHLENVDKGARHDTLAHFAELYGVAWPPSSTNELFFLTGVRLTPKQCEEFYESMRLYAVASSKVNMGTYAAGGKATVASAGVVVQRKKRVTRTTLLRKAFMVIDIDNTGVVDAASLPSIHRLLQEERKYFQSLLAGNTAQESFAIRSRCDKVKADGSLDVVAYPKKRHISAALNAAGKLRIYSLVLDVLLPLLCASGLLRFDFTTVGLLLFGTLHLSTSGASPSFLKWRDVAQRCFDSLLGVPF